MGKYPLSYLLKGLRVLERAGVCLFIHDGEIPPCSGWSLDVRELEWRYVTNDQTHGWFVPERHVVLSIGGFLTTDTALEVIVAGTCIISSYVPETVSGVFDEDDRRRCISSFDSVCDTSHPPVLFVHTLFCLLPLVHVRDLRVLLRDK